MSPRRLQVTALFQQILVIALSSSPYLGLNSYSRPEIVQARDQRVLICKIAIYLAFHSLSSGV